MHGHQMILFSSVRIIEKMPRYSTHKVTLKLIELIFLPVKARIGLKVCLFAHNSLLSDETGYKKKCCSQLSLQLLPPVLTCNDFFLLWSWTILLEKLGSNCLSSVAFIFPSVFHWRHISRKFFAHNCRSLRSAEL